MKILLTLFNFFFLFNTLWALTPNDVIVLYNSDIKESKELAEFYQKQRNIPHANMIGISMPNTEQISRNQFIRIQSDLNLALSFNKVENKSSLVTLKGVPLKVGSNTLNPNKLKDQYGLSTKRASLDSELAARVKHFSTFGALPNNYFNSPHSVLDFNQINKSEHKAPLLVTRIDAPSYALCKQIILDAINTEKSGLWGITYLDKTHSKPSNNTLNSPLNTDKAFDNITSYTETLGIPTIIENTSAPYPNNYPMKDAAIYFGGGNATINGAFKNPNFKLKKGAITSHSYKQSTSSLNSTTPSWATTLLSQGACATLGYTSHPQEVGTVQLDTFYSRLLNGHSYAESSYMATPLVSWQTVFIGDPLYTPYKHFAQRSGSINKKDKTYRIMQLLALLKLPYSKEMLKTYRIQANKSKEPKIYEFIGLLCLRNNDFKNADRFFQSALYLQQNEDDWLRASIHRIMLFHQLKNTQKALTLIEVTKSKTKRKTALNTLNELQIHITK